MALARIMIVEDERITAEYLAIVLSELGYNVTASVASGADAVKQAEHTRPDLALIDICLEGDPDGIAAARILRDRFQIPSIYLTAGVDRETLARTTETQPLGYIAKPFLERELGVSIEQALNGNRLASGVWQ
jgi:CheY-like chemotaxis protein